jgi:hypothetical protein
VIAALLPSLLMRWRYTAATGPTVFIDLVDLTVVTIARTAGEDTFTYGLMHQRQACQAAEIERALPHFTTARDATEPWAGLAGPTSRGQQVLAGRDLGPWCG